MAKKVLSPNETRELLVAHLFELGTSPDFHEPTEQDLVAYGDNIDALKTITHQTDRGKREIAIELDMTVGELEAMCIGKSVLDIGCGVGRLSSEIARLKKTRVTAVDYDPEILDRVPTAKNLRIVEGSGYDLTAAVGDEKYDIIFSAYSSLLWARNPEEKLRAIDSPLEVAAPNSRVLFIPVAQNLEHQRADRRMLAQGRVRGFPQATAEDFLRVKAAADAGEWMTVLALRHLIEVEEFGGASVEFVSSRNNALAESIHPMFNRPNDPTREAYSAIVAVR